MESVSPPLMSQTVELVITTVRCLLLYERHNIMLRQEIKLACSWLELHELSNILFSHTICLTVWIHWTSVFCTIKSANVSSYPSSSILVSWAAILFCDERSLYSVTTQSPIPTSHCYSLKTQFLITDAATGNTDSAASITVTYDQPWEEIFSLCWINGWHSMKQNGLARSVTFLVDGSSAENWTELMMAQNFTWYELISSHDWNTRTELRQCGCVQR